MTRQSKLLVNSLPKSGTNLVTSVLAEIQGLRFHQLTLNRRLGYHWRTLLSRPHADDCLVGVDQPKRVPLRLMESQFAKLEPYEYTAGHLPYCSALDGLLHQAGVRMLFVLRDPRDVVVSQVFHVLNHPHHFLHGTYRGASTDTERFVLAIKGVRRRNGSNLALGIRDKLAITEGWIGAQSALTLRFEDLVGPRGGGSSAAQQDSIAAIAEAAGLSLEPSEIEDVGRRSFATGGTFRRGVAGAWREHLQGEPERLLMEEIGDYLTRRGYQPA